MLKRRAIHLGVSPTGPPSPASATGRGRRILWALEERLIWGGRDAVGRVVDVVRWPFERSVWTIERRLIWPLQERSGELSDPVRLGGTAAVVAVALGVGVFGAVWAANSGTAPDTKPALSAAPAASTEPQREAVASAAPVLRGVAPDFTPEGERSTAKVANGEAIAAKTGAGAAGSDSASASSSAANAAPVGPAARKVAHSFAGAFVLYETGRDHAKVRSALQRTATPQLARALLRRPPRLPAGVKVPKAKVLNVVPGPSIEGVHTISVSLLRVGLTSELRLDMERDDKTGEWKVTDVLG